MTAPVVIPPEVALPLIRLRMDKLSRELRRSRVLVDIDVVALAGIVEDLVAVVEQLAAVA